MAIFLVFFGLIALLWSNLFFASAGILTLIYIQAKYAGLASLKSNKIRVFGELSCFVLALIGFWFFPLIPVEIAHFFAAVAGAVFVYHVFNCVSA